MIPPSTAVILAHCNGAREMSSLPNSSETTLIFPTFFVSLLSESPLVEAGSWLSSTVHKAPALFKTSARAEAVSRSISFFIILLPAPKADWTVPMSSLKIFDRSLSISSLGLDSLKWPEKTMAPIFQEQDGLPAGNIVKPDLFALKQKQSGQGR